MPVGAWIRRARQASGGWFRQWEPSRATPAQGRTAAWFPRPRLARRGSDRQTNSDGGRGRGTILGDVSRSPASRRSGCGTETTASPELTAKDVETLREYVRAPDWIRQTAGAWAEDGVELDEYLGWARQQRKVGPRAIGQ